MTFIEYVKMQSVVRRYCLDMSNRGGCNGCMVDKICGRHIDITDLEKVERAYNILTERKAEGKRGGKTRMIDSIDVVVKNTSRGDLFAMLAEECAELAQAALKARRAEGEGTPTPMSREQAYDQLVEELADVNNCLRALGLTRDITRYRVKSVADAKMDRWAVRIVEAKKATASVLSAVEGGE